MYYLIIRGPLGSGKTTLAEKLAKKLQAEIFSVDKILEENQLDQAPPDSFIPVENFLKVNEIILPEIKKFLKQNKTVIIEGNFYYNEPIEHLINNLQTKGFVFTLTAPLETCIERDKNRAISFGKDAAEVIYHKCNEFSYGTIINTAKNIKQCVTEIISNL